jgi:hypothetical protein
MPSTADPSGSTNEQIRTALLEYAHAPGKYHVGLRQPPLLFASIREILQIAAGREPDAEQRTDEEKTALRRAACFFTCTTLLAPGADHYALLGLDRHFANAELKERYRLLMRLIHPDFSGAGVGPWPADAAVRVNLAHDVLSSAVKRREYDASLEAAPQVPPPSTTGAGQNRRQLKPPVHSGQRRMARSRLKHLAVMCSVAAGCLVLISLFVGGQDAVHLVQRARPLVTEPILVAKQETLAASTTSAAAVAPPPTPISRLAEGAPDPSAAALPDAVPHPPSPPLLTPAQTPAAAPPGAAAPAIPTPPRVVEVAVFPKTAVEPAPLLVRVTRPEPASAPAPSPPLREIPSAPPVIAAAPPPPPTLPRAMPLPVAGVSLAEAQPLLAILLQQLESGRGDRLINMLDREARSKQGAQALSRQYDGIVDGMQPVRLSHFEFKAEPADGRLLVTGHIRLQVGEQSIGSIGKQIVLRAEFASRDGTVVMTGLSSVPN